MKQIDKQIECVKGLIPEGWTCGEGFFMSLTGKDSPCHIWISPPELPSNCRYTGDATVSAAERRELRSIELAHRRHVAGQIAVKLRGYAMLSTGLLKGMRVSQDGDQIYVRG